MSVIKFARVENFRSIRSTTLGELEDYNPIVGLNSSGKSNVLRALNLFFNGFVDEDRTPLDLTADFSTYAPKGKKKTVAVTVALAIGEDFQVRGQEEFHSANNITDTIYIKRSWSLAADKAALLEAIDFGPSLNAMRAATPEEAAAVLTHVRAVRFVYIPNHARPSDLIRTELAPLRPTLVARLRATKVYKNSSVNEIIAELGKMGDRMFGEVSKATSRGLPNVALSADLPDDFADLVFTVGVRTITDGDVARPPEYEGSGAQSFMLLHILDLADRTHRAGGFGWVQASVWALEEPESFLHAGLRAQFSTDLENYASDVRRQVFVTTHQDEFVRVAASAWLTSRSPDTSIERQSARDALMKTTQRAITTFNHPLFSFPTEPIVIVEGKLDDIYLRSAMESAKLRPRWRLLAPGSTFGEQIGGDSLLPYLKYNQQVIASRPLTAPVIVLRDWEASDRQKYDNVLKSHPYSTCLIAPSSLVNPELDETFVGIERFLPTDLIELTVPTKQLGREHGGPDARFSIRKRVLEDNKRGLATAIETGSGTGPFMEKLVAWLDNEVVQILQKIPASAFT